MQARQNEFRNRVELYNRGEFSKTGKTSSSDGADNLKDLIMGDSEKALDRPWVGSVGKYGSFICLNLLEKYQIESEDKDVQVHSKVLEEQIPRIGKPYDLAIKITQVSGEFLEASPKYTYSNDSLNRFYYSEEEQRETKITENLDIKLTKFHHEA